ncbi:exodeoxyribonuclease I [Arsenophonus endosymbiont of Lipoptena cervi]|uniref:exodeoxyribonuclease I n=1 Tax=Arsenophonus endosymbiont of Lipoptena cervi TaxID=363258 RepID=UPI00376F3AF9
MINNHKLSFIFHDYETFGKHPDIDQPAQFASIRTDLNFNVIEEPQKFFCSPTNDYLPQPESVMITGITPQYAINNGIHEAKFAKRIHDIFSVPNSCILGYNNIQFDDEITRNIFYRNFYDPYDYSWKKGNSRWDLLDVLRACYALRPDGINWPCNNETGLPSFKLEHLTIKNNIKHKIKHDAMSDVLATIEIAKLIKQAQPKIFNYFFQLRKKNNINQLIDIISMKPLVHISGIFGTKRFNTSLIAPLARHPKNRNAIIVCDLAININPLLLLDSNTLRNILFDPKYKCINNITIPIKLIHTNKCPILAPPNILSSSDAGRLKLDIDTCLSNLTILKKHQEVREKVVQIFMKSKYSLTSTDVESTDVDTMLYHGFFNDRDRKKIAIIRKTLPKNLPSLNLKFEDPRITKLLFRYRARNYFDTLTKQEKSAWLCHRRTKLNNKKITEYIEAINKLFIKYKDNKEKCNQLKELINYANQITC